MSRGHLLLCSLLAKSDISSERVEVHTHTETYNVANSVLNGCIKSGGGADGCVGNRGESGGRADKGGCAKTRDLEENMFAQG